MALFFGLFQGAVLMSSSYSFDEQLSFGKEWERQAKSHLQELFTAVSVSNIDYNEQPELQRAGIDVVFQQQTTDIDIKTQRHGHLETGNLPIETLSVVEKGKLGWFFEAESDLVVWVYPNKAGTNLHKVGYLMPLTDGLRDWFGETAETYRYVEAETHGKYGEYHTGCRLVPIDSFPSEYLVEFDPRLPTERETPQSDIQRWAGGTDD
jgi:hypothetical protein